MASNTGFLSTTELDFNSIKSNLKTYLQNQDQFSDYDFDGSNINVLLDVLSYNTYLNSFYLNMVGSEMFLDTSQLRESVVSHAKELNYLPRSKTSAVAYVDITVNTGAATPVSITIPKDYKVTTTVDNVTLTFSVPNDIIVTPVGGVYKASNTAIYEGNIVTEYFNVANNSTYVLGSENIDTRSISVYVYESNTSATYYSYEKATSLFGLTPTSNVYFLQGKESNKYEIVFGNDLTGRALSSGNLVRVQYRDTVGADGNGAYLFYKTTNINGYANVIISTVTTAAEGSDREDIDSIKFNAPRHYTTQERAVTASDYINLTKSQFPQLQAVNAYGGEELDPPQYGKVAISVKPYGTTAIISNALKSEIVTYLNQKNLTIEPVIVDPEFFYVGVTSSVNYNGSATSLSSTAVKTLVENAISNFGSSNLTEFGDDLRYSKLVTTIDNSENSIISNETRLSIIKRWSPVSQTNASLSFTFNNELYYENTLYSLPNGHELAFYSSSFNYVHTDGVTYICYIGDDGLGTLKIYTDQLISGVITRTALNNNIGSVNYYTGTISITANIYSYSGSYISLYGRPKNKDLFAVKNKFLLIDSNDVIVTVNQLII